MKKRKYEYKCPVCSFKGLYEPAYNPEGSGSDEMCPCCGFQFGLDDYGYSTNEEAHDVWRKKWIENGCNWYSESRLFLQPKDWNPVKQLEGLKEVDK